MTDRSTWIPGRNTQYDGTQTITRREELRNRRMNATVFIEKRVGLTIDGEPLYDPPVSCPANITNRIREVRTLDGDVRFASVQVMLLTPAPDVTPADRITLPDGSQPPILATNRDMAPNPLQALTLYTERTG
jgi:hypothetical protein